MERDSGFFPPPPTSEEIHEIMETSPNAVIIEMESTTPQVNGDSVEDPSKQVEAMKKSKSKDGLEENEETGPKDRVKKGKKKKKKADTIEPEYVTVVETSPPDETCNLRKNKSKTLDKDESVSKESRKKRAKKLKKAVSF